MFRGISLRIALQFTLFVFLLLLFNGMVFLVVDEGNAHQQMRFRLMRTTQIAEENPEVRLPDYPLLFPPMTRDRIRTLDADGHTLFAGPLFGEVPFSKEEGFSKASVQDEDYVLFTVPIKRNGNTEGYLQIAEMERYRPGEFPVRILLYLLVSLIISALTFSVGRFFAQRSLKPAEEMMERLEQFTQDASHELRTPLATMNSSLDLALKNEKYREGILSAKQDLKHVAVLVERLLELARLDKFVLRTAPVNLTALLEMTVERQRLLAAERGISMETHFLPEIIVIGDATLLKQVIENLLANAIKFSKKNEKVIVRLAEETFSVEDTGIGIAKDSLPHIFDRFYQEESSRAKGGFGLGLALVKRIIDLHGWSIDVQSSLGKGTTFSVAFPSQD